MADVPKLQIVGGGKMGEALLAGLLSAGWATPEQVRVVEPVRQRAKELDRMYEGIEVSDSPGAAAGHVLAVKPDDVAAACRDLPQAFAGEEGPAPLLSIAAGVATQQIEPLLPEGTPVVRAMPNTPALVGAGAAAITPGRHATDEHLGWAEQILGAVGSVVRVKESQMDAVTGLSGSGPAYIFLIAESLTEAGVLAGLPRPVSAQLVADTMLGAAKLLTQSDQGPEALRAAVTSPGGTTASGLRALEQAGVRAAFLDAVMAATARSQELGSA